MKPKCQLDSGDVVEYDVCSHKRDAYDPLIFSCIGYGTVYEIDGQRESVDGGWYFFQRVSQNEVCHLRSIGATPRTIKCPQCGRFATITAVWCNTLEEVERVDAMCKRCGKVHPTEWNYSGVC